MPNDWLWHDWRAHQRRVRMRHLLWKIKWIAYGVSVPLALFILWAMGKI